MGRLRGRSSGALFRQLERLYLGGSAVGATEGELLERFVSGRDESAFEALLARHGPMVLRVCRQLLRDPNDVDDAFQATFLILVRKAGTLRRCELLGNWLYGVAYRVAMRARALSARRTARLASAPASVASLASERGARQMNVSSSTDGDAEASPWLVREISHLPEKYRTPILLCYMEGLTHDEAAHRLGWPLGTVKGRLARAKDLLRSRLVRRGVTLSVTALVSALVERDARSAVPPSLEYATLHATQAMAGTAGASFATTSAVSIPVAALVEGVLQAMFLNQAKMIAFSLLLLAGTAATGVVVTASCSRGRDDAGQSGRARSAVPKGVDRRADARSSRHHHRVRRRRPLRSSPSKSAQRAPRSTNCSPACKIRRSRTSIN